MSFACSASAAGLVMWLIIKNPTVSMPSSRAAATCWAEMSASVLPDLEAGQPDSAA